MARISGRCVGTQQCEAGEKRYSPGANSSGERRSLAAEAFALDDRDAASSAGHPDGQRWARLSGADHDRVE